MSTALPLSDSLPDTIEGTLQALGLTAELTAVEPLARAWLQDPTTRPIRTVVARHRLMQGTIMYELLGAQGWPDPPTWAADRAALQTGRDAFRYAWAGYLAFLSCDLPTRAEIFAADELPPDLALALHLALTGLLADELPLTRQALTRVSLPLVPATPEREHLLHLACVGLVQLIRQAPGDLAAVLTATASIDAQYRDAVIMDVYSTSDPPSEATRATALELLGLLHLVAILHHTAGALERGYIVEAWTTWPHRNTAIRRIFARHLFLLPLADLFCIGCRALLTTLPRGHERDT